MNKTYLGLTVAIMVSVGLIYVLAAPTEEVNASVILMPNDQAMVARGKEVYAQNCASCHGENLKGQADWQKRDAEGYLPAPPHDIDGHTWHHPDSYLFSMTKYGIEKMIGKKYPNNMPAYEGKLSDAEIIAVLSYIKNTWPKRIQLRHDQMNMQANSK